MLKKKYQAPEAESFDQDENSYNTEVCFIIYFLILILLFISFKYYVITFIFMLIFDVITLKKILFL